MNTIKLLLLLFLPAAYSFAQSANPYYSEPPAQIIEFTIDGQTYKMREGETIRLNNTLVNPTITIKTAENRNFGVGSLSFEYPNNYSYEFEEGSGFRNWVLGGNNFIIMYFEMDFNADLKNIVSQMVEQFGPENCRLQNTSTRLGERVLYGTRIEVNIIGQNLNLDVFEIDTSDFKTRVIAFQNTKNEDGSFSMESIRTFGLIDKTITY